MPNVIQPKKIGFWDLLNSKELTSRIHQMVKDETEPELTLIWDKLGQELDDLRTTLSTMKKEVDTTTVPGEDQIRDIIRAEIAAVFKQLYIKRATWK